MTGNPRITAVGSGGDAPEAPNLDIPGEEILALQEEWEELEAEVERPRRTFDWLFPAIATIAILGWTGFFVFAHQVELLAGGTPQQWSGWVTAWSGPVLLVVAVWLLVMRSSSKEASRFGDAAKLLSDESRQLEARLVTVNRELSLARDFIAAQARDLESLGRLASDRLSQNAERLAGLVIENGKQIDSIASVSVTALENMDKLRGDLPVIANSARDVTSQIGNAGRTAHTQLEELVSGFHRLNTFGEASERQVQSLRAKVDAALAAFETQASRLGEIATARFASLDERSEEFRANLDSREVEALAAIRRRAEKLSEELTTNWTDFDAMEEAAVASLRTRMEELRKESDAFDIALREGESDAIEKWTEAIDGLKKRLSDAMEEIAELDTKSMDHAQERLVALSEEARIIDEEMQERVARFLEGIEARQVEHDSRQVAAASSLEKQLAELDAAIAARHEGHVAHMAGLSERGETLAIRLEELSQQVEAITSQGKLASDDLLASIEALSAKIQSSRDTLAATGNSISDLTDSSVRLLELIQAGSKHSREQLPQALIAAQEKIDAFEAQTKSIGLMLNEAGEQGKALSDYVLGAQEGSKQTLDQLLSVHEKLAGHHTSHSEQVETLRAALAALSEESESLSRRAQGELSEAVETLQGALNKTITQLEVESGEAIEALAERIGEESARAIDHALKRRTKEAIGELEQAAAHASGVSREAACQLRDQLSKVDELAGNLESRVQRARERAEEQVDNDFARRVALITESLNSNAIDISKALSNEVTDTAWASYLRGDRGIFTRRAVRLLESSEAREIAEIYERDHDFREHVSRYIHDFEAMLRTMLSTRDGNALGVTLLSSDMGKLYVALAQAIDRLRD